MAHDEDEDLYDEEFDFVDEDDVEEDEVDGEEEAASADDSELADEPVEARAKDRTRERTEERPDERPDERAEDDAPGEGEEPTDEYGRTEPAANYVVHVYEDRKFKRTIDRPFTPEDAELFATEYNRTGKNYSRVAVTSKNDAKPKKALD